MSTDNIPKTQPIQKKGQVHAHALLCFFTRRNADNSIGQSGPLRAILRGKPEHAEHASYPQRLLPRIGNGTIMEG